MQTEMNTQNSPGATTVVAVNGLTKKFNSPMDGEEFVVLDNISLNVDEGNFASIVGPSGCGKSTLLNIIAGIETHESHEGGSVKVFGDLSVPTLAWEFLRLEGEVYVALNRQPVEQPGVLEDVTDTWR